MKHLHEIHSGGSATHMHHYRLDERYSGLTVTTPIAITGPKIDKHAGAKINKTQGGVIIPDYLDVAAINDGDPEDAFDCRRIAPYESFETVGLGELYDDVSGRWGELADDIMGFAGVVVIAVKDPEGVEPRYPFDHHAFVATESELMALRALMYYKADPSTTDDNGVLPPLSTGQYL